MTARAQFASESQLESLAARLVELEARVAVLERERQIRRLRSEPRDPQENRHYEARGDAVYVVGDGQGGYGQSCVLERCRGFEMHSAGEVAERVAKLLNVHGL